MQQDTATFTVIQEGKPLENLSDLVELADSTQSIYK